MPEDVILVPPEAPHADDVHRTHLVRAFAVCAMLAVLLIGGQVYVAVFRQPKLQLAVATPEEDPDALAKAKDSDRDGISDYDELRIYFTSPYLDDSDSDGVRDREELLAGTDPNCPQGRPCGMRMLETPLSDLQNLATTAPPDPSSEALKKLQGLSALGPLELRKLLVDNGMEMTAVAKMTDDDLMTIYRQTLESTALRSSSGPGAAKTAPSGTIAVPKNPTPKEVRDLLKQGGITDEQLGALTDADLLKLYQETLVKVSSERE